MSNQFSRETAIKQGIRRNFARRVTSYDRHANIQRFSAHELMTRVRADVARASSILEIGCGTGYLTQQLRSANPTAYLIALDMDFSLVTWARQRLGQEDSKVAWLVMDGETIAKGSFDMIISNATFHWFTTPGSTLATYFHCLKSGGLLVFSSMGPKTFKELAASLLHAAQTLSMAPAPEIQAQGFLDREAWAGLLIQAGFQQVQMSHELVTVNFPSAWKFLKDLQAIGATNPQPKLFSPRLLKALIASYEDVFFRNGQLPATYEIIWAVAQK